MSLKAIPVILILLAQWTLLPILLTIGAIKRTKLLKLMQQQYSSTDPVVVQMQHRVKKWVFLTIGVWAAAIILAGICAYWIAALNNMT